MFPTLTSHIVPQSRTLSWFLFFRQGMTIEDLKKM